MRTIGLIGGMSWVSTAEYYRVANELVASRLGGLHSARILLESVDFAEIEELKLADRWDDIGVRLSEAGSRLEAAGAELVVLCTNTMHHVAAPIEAALTVPFVHIADTTAEAIRSAGVRRVGLLGTAFTMNEGFYRERLAARGVEVLVPPEDDRRRVSEIIYDELRLDVISEESRSYYLEVVDRLVAEGAQAIILGCTEIELLIDGSHLPVPAFRTAFLHVQAAVDLALRS
jgi:aspartate racemase